MSSHTSSPKVVLNPDRQLTTWKHPLLLIKMPSEDYQPVQELCVINNETITMHSVVPNPYIIFGVLPPDVTWFTCLNLKTCLPLLACCSYNSTPFTYNWNIPRQDIFLLDLVSTGLQNTHTIFGRL